MRAGKLPDWLRVRLPAGADAMALQKRLGQLGLHTVCEEARCPNQGECWGAGTATVMILGDTCTRACRFCAVATGNPGGRVDAGEPESVARAVAAAAQLRYVVLTSVDRDDLADGGAAHFASCIRSVHDARAGVRVEALVPDYVGGPLRTVVGARPEVLGHNLEVVRRLTPKVRDRRASYDRSLQTLREARDLGGLTKSSLMVGLGETRAEVLEALGDLREAGVEMVTLGQYLRPSTWHLPVERYVDPDEFRELEGLARGLGFRFVAAGPLVRSSYRAAELYVDGRLTEAAGR